MHDDVFATYLVWGASGNRQHDTNSRGFCDRGYGSGDYRRKGGGVGHRRRSSGRRRDACGCYGDSRRERFLASTTVSSFSIEIVLRSGKETDKHRRKQEEKQG